MGLTESLQTEHCLVKEMAPEKRASNWPTLLPLKRYGFMVTIFEFRDRFCIRYSIETKNTPISFPRGKKFTPSHVLRCAKGGYTHMRLNEIRDSFAKIRHNVCYDVKVKPTPELLRGESFIYKSYQ